MPKPSEPRMPTRGKADLARLRRMTDREIAATAPEELPLLPDSFWRNARVVSPVGKRAISLRIDEDVIDWFRASGPKYQSRMNAVLRTYVDAVRAPSKKRRERAS